MPFILPFIGPALGAMGALGKGRAEGRQAESAANQQQDLLRQRAAEFNRQTPGIRAGNAVRGDILRGVQPFMLSGEGRNLTGSGGLTPGLLTQGTRELGHAMNREAVLSQLAGQKPSDALRATPGYEDLPAGPGGRIGADTSPYASFAPTIQPHSNFWDKLLIGGGVAGDFLGKQRTVAPGYQDVAHYPD